MIIPSFVWARTYPGLRLLREKTHSVNIQYQSAKKLPFLQKKAGLTIGLAPVNDTRQGRLYVGRYIYRRVSNYLRCEPFPLEEAIRDSVIELLSFHGIKTVPISRWDGREESLKNIGTDSVLMIDIVRFWAEGTASSRGGNVYTSIYLIIRLGVKKEHNVYRRDVYTINEDPIDRLTPEGTEQIINQNLKEALDTFFSDPY